MKSLSNQPQSLKILILCVFASIAGVATPSVLNPSGNFAAQETKPKETGNGRPSAGPLTKGTPDYDTVLPSGKTIADYGGWTRVSPPNRDPVYAYVDRIRNIPINISQQPLPKEFADQPDQQVQLLAQGYSANEELDLAVGIGYLGTSAKGPQSVIIVKGSLLILIKASAAISEKEWENYINSLR